ncbi:MAG: sulfatase-like hydrolase/transferase [Chitinophagaceae bacterium]|nr:sulfatase-like hydrolase/transferase [Chitinophagaceae bacterium]
MRTKSFLFPCIFLLLLTRVEAQTVLKDRHPNILFLFTDDQRFSTIGRLGLEPVHTPNLDELYRQGTVFTQAHIMGGLQGAICMPSRAMLMTGKSLFHQHQDGSYIAATDIMMPQFFRQQGYATFVTGKWHNGAAALNRAFASGDNIYLGGMHRYETGGHFTPILSHYDSTGGYKNKFTGDHFSTIYYADAVIDFINRQKNDDQPFFAYVAFTTPHDPRTPPKEFLDLYDSVSTKLPPNFLLQHPFDNGELQVRDEVLLPVPRDTAAVKAEVARYYAMISEADYEIGRILQALKASGQYENTIIVFAGDNGLAVGQHGLLGKQSLYEHSVRVPLVMAGPGIKKDNRYNGYVYLYDVFATLREAAGFKSPLQDDGISFAGALKNEPFGGRDHLFFVYANLQRAVKKNGLKLIRYNVNGESKTQLFDLNKDPYEMKDVSGDKQYTSSLKKLTRLLHTEMKESGDFCDPQQLNWGYPGKLTGDVWTKLFP